MLYVIHSKENALAKFLAARLNIRQRDVSHALKLIRLARSLIFNIA